VRNLNRILRLPRLADGNRGTGKRLLSMVKSVNQFIGECEAAVHVVEATHIFHGVERP
jgi:hypothetical protein